MLHNPPLVYDSESSVALEFELVCPASDCGAVDALATVRTADGRVVELDPSSDRHRTLNFEVPAQIAGSQGFAYRVSFTVDGQAIAAYPGNDGFMEALSLGEAEVLDLGRATWQRDAYADGELVVSGSWGGGSDEFGLTPELTGPSSFDVGPGGEIGIVDRSNARLVQIDGAGHRTNLPVEFSTGAEADVALSSDGRIVVLNASAAPGAASLDVFVSAGGELVTHLRLPAAGNAVRAVGDDIYVEADDSWWTPVMRVGKALDDQEQAVDGLPGLPDAAGESFVTRKHLREEGNEVRVVLSGREGLRAWRIVGETNLGFVHEASRLQMVECSSY